jgi:DNA polymerase
VPKCWFDTETFSPVPIRSGAWRYAEQAEVMLLPFAYEDESPYVWDLTETTKPPAALLEMARDPAIDFWGHNSAGFDWPVFSFALRWLFDAVPQARRRDTMAQAYAHSLPGALGSLCDVFNITGEDAKDRDGKKLIQLFCVPPNATMKRGRATRHTHPDEWEKFKTYASRDITSMRLAHKRMPAWNYPNNERELAVWHLDNEINYRGFAVDTDLAMAAIEIAANEKKRLAARTVEISNGALESTTQRDKMLAHLLAEYSVTLPDLQGATLERRLQDPDLPGGLRELLAVRLQASSASVAKYKALMASVSSDGRLRGTSQYCGAGRTGRWAHRNFQPGNMSRVPKYVAREWERAIESIKVGAVDMLYENVMEVAGSCVRGCIIASPGKKLAVADLSNIEGRMLAWLAGEDWKLQAFRDFDTVTGHDAKGNEIRKGVDLYKLAVALAFAMDPADVDDYLRQIGKVLELMLGYEGGVGAFITGAATYGIDLDEMAEKATPGLPAWALNEAAEFYDWSVRMKRNTFGLKRDTFIACDALKRAWRAKNPAIAAFWKDLQSAVISATNRPGVTIQVQRLKVRRDGNWLRIRLPSGRFLCYPSPRVDEAGKFSYAGLNQYTRKWGRISSYGGKLAENVTQAAARDQLAWGMLQANGDGFNVGLSIHDEAVTDAPDDEAFNEQRLSAHLASDFGWNEGLPLAAAGFCATRYRK